MPINSESGAKDTSTFLSLLFFQSYFNNFIIIFLLKPSGINMGENKNTFERYETLNLWRISHFIADTHHLRRQLWHRLTGKRKLSAGIAKYSKFKRAYILFRPVLNFYTDISKLSTRSRGFKCCCRILYWCSTLQVEFKILKYCSILINIVPVLV